MSGPCSGFCQQCNRPTKQIANIRKLRSAGKLGRAELINICERASCNDSMERACALSGWIISAIWTPEKEAPDA